jgi:hypothetical protein
MDLLYEKNNEDINEMDSGVELSRKKKPISPKKG